MPADPFVRTSLPEALPFGDAASHGLASPPAVATPAFAPNRGAEPPRVPRGRTVPLIELSPSRDPLYIAIYKQLRTMIVDGTWPPGTRLASSRILARDLGCSRGTAHVAIEQLIAEGWAESTSRSGVFVTGMGRAVRQVEPARKVEGDERTFEKLVDPVHLFPIAKWRALQNRVWEEEPVEALLAVDEPRGARQLRRAIARLLCASRGIQADEDEIVVTTSVPAAVEIIARAVGRPGEQVGLECPGDPALAARLRYARLASRPVPLDSEGLTIPGTDGARYSAVVTSTALQTPTGVSMSPQRSAELRAWATRKSCWIIERDCTGHLASDGQKPRPPLRATASEGLLYVRGLDRLAYPGLGLAFILAPRSLVPALAQERDRVDGRLGCLDQLVLARFISEGFLAAHLRGVRPALRDRENQLREVIAPFAGHLFAEPVTSGGMLYLPALAAAPAALCRAFQSGSIPAKDIEQFGHSESFRGIVVPFADLSSAEISQASGAVIGALEAVASSLNGPRLA